MDTVLGMKNEEKSYSEVNNNVISSQAVKVSKEKKKTPKLQNLGVRIPVETNRRLNIFVLSKHGKLHGCKGPEVTKALESWMDNQQHSASFTFSMSKVGSPRTDVVEKYRLIAMELKEFHNFPYVHHFTLRDAIKKVLGDCDGRTLNKYLKTIRKLCKEEFTRFGTAPMLDVSRFIEKIQSDDW